MKKLLALAIALLFLAVPVMAQQAAQISVNARINRMGAFGTGIAISETNPMDFELLKIGIAGVKVGLEGEESEVMVGILYFGEDRYRLKEVVIGNGSASANIYDSESEQVGSISLDSYPKGDREVWAGDLMLDGAEYNAYVIQVPRKLKAVEKARRVFSYCEDNPAGCLRVMRGVGSTICDPEGEGANCRERIRTYCESNTEDRRCVALRLAYCRHHLDDADCRAEMIEECKERVDEEICDRLGEVYERVVQQRPEVVRKVPQWFLTVRERLQSGIQPQAGAAGE